MSAKAWQDIKRFYEAGGKAANYSADASTVRLFRLGSTLLTAGRLGMTPMR